MKISFNQPAKVVLTENGAYSVNSLNDERIKGSRSLGLPIQDSKIYRAGDEYEACLDILYMLSESCRGYFAVNNEIIVE